MSQSYRGQRNHAPETRSRDDPAHGSTPVLLYAGIAVFLALLAVTVREVRNAWSHSAAQSRAQAVLDLARVRTPNRPTDQPGAIAWLDREIRRYEQGRSAAGGDDASGGLSMAADPGPVPAPFAALVTAIDDARDTLASVDPARFRRMADDEVRPVSAPPGEDAMQFRSQRFLAYRPSPAAEEHWLVMTRSRAVEGLPAVANRSNRFLRWAVPYLVAVHARIGRLPAFPGRPPPRLVRVYAIGEDGSFVSLPRIDSALEEEARRAITWEEGQEFRKRPRLPNFVSNEFFFQFDFGRSPRQARFSGLYLDLGGQGLVTTVTAPLTAPAGDFRAVLAIDLTFEIDWAAFAKGIAPPLLAHLARLEPPTHDEWPIWGELQTALDHQRADGETIDPLLTTTLARLKARERGARASVSRGPGPFLDETDQAAVAVFQVTRRDWLVVLFPKTAADFPWLAVALLAFLGLVLLIGFEHNRRRAEHAQRRAEGELRERQNLLNTMQVPLAVVDPNSDLVVAGNEAATAIGITPGSCIGDLVADELAREHYDRMHRAGSEPRRAYGVPLAIQRPDGGTDRRLALIRSVAVTAPIRSLQADERHRLGMLFLVDPETDLTLFSEELEKRVRGDERQRLSGLLTHGVDTLARVLDAYLGRGAKADDPFARWLADYLSRRIRIAAWLFDHWDARPPLPPAATVERSQVVATLERFQHVFSLVRSDADLRARLHWSNGVLAAPAQADRQDGARIFDVAIAWPERNLFSCPVHGGVGLFLEEVLINAIRHGLPASRPRIEVRHDPVRRQLVFEVENAIQGGDAREDDDLEPYGGRRILARLAYLFGWPSLRFERRATTFRVRWCVPVGERGKPGDSD